MEQVKKIRTRNQVINAVNTRNRPLVDLVHNLLLNFDVLVQQKDNVRQTGKWIGSFKPLDIEGKICKIHLPFGPTKF